MMPFTFATRVNGIPCQCKVTFYAPSTPMRITGPGFGDAEPPEPEVFEYEILDRKGYKAAWLERLLVPADDHRLLTEFGEAWREEMYGLAEVA